MKVMYLCREILNEERCPGFLLEAVHSAIKKKRKLIKAKMLGTTVNECSSRSVLTHSFIAYGSKGGNVQKRTQFLFLPVMTRRGPLCLGAQKSMVGRLTGLKNQLSHAFRICEYGFGPHCSTYI